MKPSPNAAAARRQNNFEEATRNVLSAWRKLRRAEKAKRPDQAELAHLSSALRTALTQLDKIEEKLKLEEP